jgi:hypothetical protein
MGPFHHIASLVWAEPQNQIVFVHAAKHVAVLQMADTAEHLFIFRVLPAGYDFPYARFEFFIVGHGLNL